jgi:transcriptional regulator with XRE-family HTH domain
MSIADLAKTAKISPSTVMRWEKGEREPKISTFAKVAIDLEITWQEILESCNEHLATDK